MDGQQPGPLAERKPSRRKTLQTVVREQRDGPQPAEVRVYKIDCSGSISVLKEVLAVHDGRRHQARLRGLTPRRHDLAWSWAWS